MEVAPWITADWLRSLDVFWPSDPLIDDFREDWPCGTSTRDLLRILHTHRKCKYGAYYTAILFRCFGGDPCGICPQTSCKGFIGQKCFSHCDSLRKQMFEKLGVL